MRDFKRQRPEHKARQRGTQIPAQSLERDGPCTSEKSSEETRWSLAVLVLVVVVVVAVAVAVAVAAERQEVKQPDCRSCESCRICRMCRTYCLAEAGLKERERGNGVGGVW